MKAAVMQPYLFPYIGYWQLLNAVDKFVILDDVNFIKRGYINRNSILINGRPYLFSIPVRNVSQNRLIMDTELCFGKKEKRTFLARIENAYCKAPYFGEIMPLLEDIICTDTDDLTEYIRNSIDKIKSFLGLNTIIVRSSEMKKDNSLAGQERIIEICRQLCVDTYINLPGGKRLYQTGKFKEEGIKLYFLTTRYDRVIYPQFGGTFVENLSVIDILMFNSTKSVRKLLGEYELDG